MGSNKTASIGSTFLLSTLMGGMLSLLPVGDLSAAQHGPTSAGYRVIVHPENAIFAVDKRFVSDAFLKRVTRWDGGEPIRPVDQTVRSPSRKQFSKDVLQRSVDAVTSYWQQMIFSGREVPPPQLSSDHDVVRYVLTHEGAIGYVSESGELGGTRALTVK